MDNGSDSIRDGSYVTIQAFMVKDLNLSGNELMVYAIIFGFSQEDGCWFTGSRKYLADWCRTSKRTISTNLKKLVEKGLVERRSRPMNDVLHYDYRIVRQMAQMTDQNPETPTAETVSEKPGDGETSMLPGFMSDGEIVEKVIGHLNEVAGTNYRATTESYVKLVRARLKDGYSIDDFMTIIDKKCGEWLGTPYAAYLKPTTLFSKSHFDTYLNQPEPNSGKKGASYDDGWDQGW